MTTLTGDETISLASAIVGPNAMADVLASDVNTPAQSLINAAHRAMRFSVSNFAALTALTGLLNNERVFVRDFGAYRYDATSTATLLSPWVINGNGGVGRFIHSFFDLVAVHSATSKLATVDASGLLENDFKNQIFEQKTLNSTSNADAFTSSSWADAPASRLITFATDTDATDPVLANWSVEIHASFGVQDNTAGHILETRLAIDVDGSTYAIGSTEKSQEINGYKVIYQCALVDLPALGNVTEVKLQARLSGGAVSCSFERTNMIAKLIRRKA